MPFAMACSRIAGPIRPPVGIHPCPAFEDAAEQALVAHRRGIVALSDKARAEHQRVLRAGMIDLGGLAVE